MRSIVVSTTWVRVDRVEVPDEPQSDEDMHDLIADEVQLHVGAGSELAEWEVIPGVPVSLPPTREDLARGILQVADSCSMHDLIWLENPAVRMARSVLDIPATGRYSHYHIWFPEEEQRRNRGRQPRSAAARHGLPAPNPRTQKPR